MYPNQENSIAGIRFGRKASDYAELRPQTLTGMEMGKLWNGNFTGKTDPQINLSRIPADIYMVVLKTGNGLQEVSRLVVKHDDRLP